MFLVIVIFFKNEPYIFEFLRLFKFCLPSAIFPFLLPPHFRTFYIFYNFFYVCVSSFWPNIFSIFTPFCPKFFPYLFLSLSLIVLVLNLLIFDFFQGHDTILFLCCFYISCFTSIIEISKILFLALFLIFGGVAREILFIFNKLLYISLPFLTFIHFIFFQIHQFCFTQTFVFFCNYHDSYLR